eukprot:scaffold6.g2805.t1
MNGSTGEPGGGEQATKGDLLMRFFESEWFDTWIAVTYLFKSTSPGVQDYLCNRLYTLPVGDIERYLSQLCQLCVSRPGSPLERVLIDLCAQSLRLAVKTYWLLLAISQDQPRNQHVATLRDCCEQAALEGHWDLPFRDSRLLMSPVRSRVSLQGAMSPPLISSPPESVPVPWPKTATLLGLDMRPPELRRPASFDGGSRALSPEPLRPMSPEGLGGGIFSTVFMDTGVEGLMVDAPLPDEGTVQEARYRMVSPKGSSPNLHGAFANGSTRPKLDADRVSSLRAQLGEGEGVSELLLRAASVDDGRPVVVRAPVDDGLFSPPSSPRRRETTFGATLDFLEALCAASNGLNAIVGEDRQAVLHKALHRINAEIDKASRKGVAIWFPACCQNHQRVVRLACRESTLLNSREKAPFTLCVEVLDEEQAATQEAEARRVADAAAMRAACAASGCADSAMSLLADADGAEALPTGPEAAAAAAAAAGIAFVAHHQRSISHETSSSSLAAAAMAAVQDSSAAGREGAGGAGLLAAAGGEQAAAAQAAGPPLQSEVSCTSTLEPNLSFADFASTQSASPAKSAGSARSSGSPPLLVRRLSTELQTAAGPGSDGGSGASEPLPQPGGDSLELRPGARHAYPCPEGCTPGAGGCPHLPAGRVQGAGTWIGGGFHRPSLTPPARGPGARPEDGITSELKTSLAGLRGEPPTVRVRLEVVSQGPTAAGEQQQRPALARLSGGSTASSASSVSATTAAAAMAGSSSAAAAHAAAAPLAAADAERRRSGAEASSSGAGAHQCDSSRWACRLGLCKLCNSGLATLGDVEPAEPRVRVHFVVQGGLDLTIRKSPAKHHRVPSHEALLKVARQHKLPAQQLAPAAPAPLPPPPAGAPPGAAALPAAAGPGAAPCAAAAGPGRPAAAPAASAALTSEQAAAAAAHGEPWPARKQRVRLSSPYGSRPGWDLRCVIVKTGDDCRQELLAMQLIGAFHEIFAEAQLPLWLRPYEVLVTSSRTALIEMVPNAPSIHAIKARGGPDASLARHFEAKWGPAGPGALAAARRNFTDSLAAYSLVSYLLQIKDRHNGNLLLDSEGHIIHIDFGFMLSNSPGGVNFESAPFKLTRELLEVMGSDSEGRASELFDYFKVLMIQGFLAVRKHADRITLLAELMAGSGMPCFKSRAAAVQGLRKRFHLALPEPQVVEVVLGLIADSLDAWRTRQYDYYQRVLNGIL